MNQNIEIFLNTCKNAIIEDTKQGNWRDGNYNGEYLVSNNDILVEIEIDNCMYSGYVTYGATFIVDDDIYKSCHVEIVYVFIHDAEIYNDDTDDRTPIIITDEMLSKIEIAYSKTFSD